MPRPNQLLYTAKTINDTDVLMAYCQVLRNVKMISACNKLVRRSLRKERSEVIIGYRYSETAAIADKLEDRWGSDASRSLDSALAGTARQHLCK
jgi:hypothetical protein